MCVKNTNFDGHPRITGGEYTAYYYDSTAEKLHVDDVMLEGAFSNLSTVTLLVTTIVTFSMF